MATTTTTDVDTIYDSVRSNDPSKLPIPKRVLVIGGGPAGLVSLRNLIERGVFETVQLVERRSDIGGVWNLEEDSSPEESSKAPCWPSPAYKGLIGNVLPKFLSFSGSPFPPPPTSDEGQPFPSLTETFAYLKEFSKPLQESGSIRLNTEVIHVEERAWGEGWKVVLRDWSDEGTGTETEEIWDAVVVAVHWHDNAEWPDTPGLDELRNLGLAKHAKTWRGPQGNEGKTCLVIGNANSANDIATQLASVAEAPVYQSMRRPTGSGFPSLPDERIQTVSPVVKYVADIPEGHSEETPKIPAHLEDGTIIEDVDVVYLGTGYYPSPDFIKVFERPELHSEPGYDYPSSSPESDSPNDPPAPEKESNDQGESRVRPHVPVVPLHTRPRRVPHMHRLSIYAPNPSLAFIGSVMTYTPFTTADIVSTFVALVFSQRLSIPSSTWDRLEYERARLEVVRSRREGVENPSSFLTYSVMSVDEEAYGRELRADVVAVLPELDASLPIWDEETSKEKEHMFKTKFEALKWEEERSGGAILDVTSEVSTLA